MAVEIWCELVCAQCSTSICGQFSTEARIPRRDLMAEAKRTGAVFQGTEVFCCRAHSALHAKLQAGEE